VNSLDSSLDLSKSVGSVEGRNDSSGGEDFVGVERLVKLDGSSEEVDDFFLRGVLRSRRWR